MHSKKVMWILKGMIISGLLLVLLGHYFISYAKLPETMGITGMMISAGCIAFGLILSLPTKMYLTFIWVRAEQEKRRQVKLKSDSHHR